MKIKTKYLFAILSLILSISLVAPFCCHAGSISSSEAQAHHTQTLAHTAHSQHHVQNHCTCGHQLRKIKANLKQDVSLSSQEPSFGVIFYDYVFSGSEIRFSARYFFTLSTQHHLETPIHLLNSVFLN